MTDFFGDLERELRGAHRRDSARSGFARRLPSVPRVPVVRLAAAAALVALVAAVLTTVDTNDAERAATPPVPTTDSGWTGYAPLDDCVPQSQVRATVASTFSVVLEGQEVDRGLELPGDDVTMLSKPREAGGHIFVPVSMGARDCEDRDVTAGICFGADGAVACAPLSRALQEGLALRWPYGDIERVKVLAPDGVGTVTIGSIVGGVEDNVATFELEGDQRGAAVRPLDAPGDRTYEPAPIDATPCREVGKLDGDVPREITDNFTLFSQDDMSDYSAGGADFGADLAAIYFRHGTTFKAAGVEFALVAGRIGDGSRPCEELEPGRRPCASPSETRAAASSSSGSGTGSWWWLPTASPRSS
jgi:hypothetical protein